MALPLSNGTWTLDTMHTQLGFSIRHLGISTIRGSFVEFEGGAVVNGDTGTINVSAAVSSIATGNAMRDGHLQAPDFFDAENHPKISFVSKSIAITGETTGTITGDLTIRGITKPVTFDTTFHGIGVFPVDNKNHAGFEATATINRSDFGVSYGVPIASDAVKLQLDVQLVQQD